MFPKNFWLKTVLAFVLISVNMFANLLGVDKSVPLSLEIVGILFLSGFFTLMLLPLFMHTYKFQKAFIIDLCKEIGNPFKNLWAEKVYNRFGKNQERT